LDARTTNNRIINANAFSFDGVVVKETEENAVAFGYVPYVTPQVFSFEAAAAA